MSDEAVRVSRNEGTGVWRREREEREKEKERVSRNEGTAVWRRGKKRKRRGRFSVLSQCIE